jgi:S-sulfo-L-cysteine synthase (3-phospho-L-serine-dependent)
MRIKKSRNIIAYVSAPKASSSLSLKQYGKAEKKKFRTMFIIDEKHIGDEKEYLCDILIKVDFNKPHRIAEALLPYQDELLAISCRSEANISRFAKVIPFVPYLRTPTSESLTWATDKYEMRKRFRLYDPKITPKFTRVKDTTKPELKRVASKVGFPMIIKPTNLAASLFVSICYHEEDLEEALKTCFKKLEKAYANDKRMEEPKVIAEQYMEGDMYSIDSYVNSRGAVYHLPLVRVKTGKDIGHQDFYGYTQMTPTILKGETVKRAEAVTDTAIHALGLRSTTVHTELMKIDNVWKVIEVGPRMGGARDELYGLSCSIDHPLNDILIRIPKKPKIPKKCQGSAVYMKWFLPKEGIITEMKGIKKIEQLESFYKIEVNKKVGDKSVFARRGGRSIFNLYLYNSDRARLLADIRRVEQLVKIKVK